MAKNQKRRPTKAEAGAKIAPASVNRGGGYYDQKTSEDQLAYIERQLAAGERARQNRQAPEDDGEYWNLESESEQIAYIENQLKVAEQNRQTRQEAATRKTSGKVARPDGVQTTAEPAAKSGKTPYDQTAAQQQRRASADYWQQAAEQAATAQGQRAGIHRSERLAGSGARGKGAVGAGPGKPSPAGHGDAAPPRTGAVQRYDRAGAPHI